MSAERLPSELMGTPVQSACVAGLMALADHVVERGSRWDRSGSCLQITREHFASHADHLRTLAALVWVEDTPSVVSALDVCERVQALPEYESAVES